MDKITARILAEVTGKMLLLFTEIGNPEEGTIYIVEHYKLF